MLFLLLFTLGINGQQIQQISRKEKRIEKQARLAFEIDSLLQSGCYAIEVQTALPRGWQPIQLTSLYHLTLNVDSVKADLPYYGRTYNVTFPMTDGGIKVNAPVNNYRLKKKREHTEITFDTRNDFDTYRFVINVSHGGYASVDVNCNNRQGIGFNGIVLRQPW